MASYDLKMLARAARTSRCSCLGFLKDEAKVCPDCGGRDVQQRFTGFGGVTGLVSGALPRHRAAAARAAAARRGSGFS